MRARSVAVKTGCSVVVARRWAIAMPIGIETRTVISVNDRVWVPNKDDIVEVDGVQCIALRKTCRGLAGFVGVSLKSSYPLRSYGWFDTTRAARSREVNALLRDMWAARDPHGADCTKDNPSTKGIDTDDIDALVTLELPSVELDGRHEDGVQMRVRTELRGNRVITMELTSQSLAYIQVAIAASQPDEPSPKRARTVEPMANGVHFSEKRQSLMVLYETAEGRIRRKFKRPSSLSIIDIADASKWLVDFKTREGRGVPIEHDVALGVDTDVGAVDGIDARSAHDAEDGDTAVHPPANIGDDSGPVARNCGGVNEGGRRAAPSTEGAVGILRFMRAKA